MAYSNWLNYLWAMHLSEKGGNIHAVCRTRQSIDQKLSSPCIYMYHLRWPELFELNRETKAFPMVATSDQIVLIFRRDDRQLPPRTVINSGQSESSGL